MALPSSNLSVSDLLNDTEDGLETVYEYTDETIIFKIFLELFTLIGVVSASVNILIAYVIFKYRRLRKDNANILLANWCIVNTLFMLSCPMVIRLNIYWDFYYITSSSTFCLIEQTEFTLLFCNIEQMILLTFYWYYKLYNQTLFAKYMRNFKFFLCMIYVMTLSFIAIHVDVCYNRRLYTVSELTLFVTYLFYIIFVIVMNVIHVVKKRGICSNNKRNVPLILTNTFFCAICPAVCMSLIGMVIYLPSGINVVLFSISFLIAIGNPLYFFFILFKYHEDFRTFFKHFFSFQCRKYSDDELMESPVVFNNEEEAEENKC